MRHAPGVHTLRSGPQLWHDWRVGLHGADLLGPYPQQCAVSFRSRAGKRGAGMFSTLASLTWRRERVRCPLAGAKLRDGSRCSTSCSHAPSAQASVATCQAGNAPGGMPLILSAGICRPVVCRPVVHVGRAPVAGTVLSCSLPCRSRGWPRRSSAVTILAEKSSNMSLFFVCTGVAGKSEGLLKLGRGSAALVHTAPTGLDALVSIPFSNHELAGSEHRL